MAKRFRKRHQIRRIHKSKADTPRPLTIETRLEQGTIEGMRVTKDKIGKLLKYHWDCYAELALLRSQIQDELKKVLIQSCLSNYQFQRWQRAVKWKYGLHPLSTVGSLTSIGGRFNTGSDVNSEVPSFPALYLACDKDTALQNQARSS